MNSEGKSELKSGFTTGACAAVVAKAAWLLLADKLTSNKGEQSVSLRFPDCELRNFMVNSCELSNKTAFASTVKDAGDDPDVTDKAVITAEFRMADESELTEKDYLLECGEAKVILRGGDGVGLATKLGIDIPVGKWAINPIPREMICANLLEAGCGVEKGTWLAKIAIANGANLAKKTLNPTLGIVDGLSILGTTGIVEPKSHAAYIKTIEILLKGLAREQVDTVVFATGARTIRAAMKDFPDLPEYAFIRIGDFIADSLKLASEMRISQIVVCCMPGKLFKYASGHKYTHAHNVKLDLKEIIPLLEGYKIKDSVINKALENVSFRGLVGFFDEDIREKIVDDIGKKALLNIKKWCNSYNSCEVRCYDYHNTLQGSWRENSYVK